MTGIIKTLITLTAMLPVLGSMAQQRDARLELEVTSVPGDMLEGQEVKVTHTDFQIGYGALTLDAEGKCALNLYSGNHELTLERDGFKPLSRTFTASSGETVKLNLTLEEETRDPYSLTADVNHDWVTGKDDISISWNTEAPALFDDFESYEPFAISFGEWTGIDGDSETTAALVGMYPNRGVLQYAQIINPLTVTPTWWYEYPVLRPYSGQQYVGFIRTSSGAANDDWLISPEVTVGTDNVLSFMAKAADRYPERFMVYVTTVTDNPRPEDFERIDTGNFESVEFENWTKFSYDLADWKGKTIKFAIRFISDAARFGSFMLMVDDVYVGQNRMESQAYAAHRVAKSKDNVNERFDILLDGVKVGETSDYEFVIENVTPGNHTVGVQAIYLEARSQVTEIDVETGVGPFAALTVNVSADSKLSPEGCEVMLLSHADASRSLLAVNNGKVEWSSLPCGEYDVSVAEGAYNAYMATVTVTEDAVHDMILTDRMLAPYNLTASVDEERNATVRWNRELSFVDTFDEYEDFATGSFGDWITIDCDKMPVYPIGLGSATNIVSFPGSGDAANPKPIPPMVFNPWMTEPAMLPTDERIAPTSGEKQIIFFSTQSGLSDDWLISPEIEIRDGYELTFNAQAYSTYPESLEICVSTDGADPSDFTLLAEVEKLSDWKIYSVDLAEYVGKTVRIGIHYTSFDAFMAQIDDFKVGSKDGEAPFVDFGNVVNYEVYLDGELAATTDVPEIILPEVSPGAHTVDVYAVYKSGRSDKGSVSFNAGSTVMDIMDQGEPAEMRYYDLLGREVITPMPHGVYIVRDSTGTAKKMIMKQ